LLCGRAKLENYEIVKNAKLRLVLWYAHALLKSLHSFPNWGGGV
jgi:hypothetical protein